MLTRVVLADRGPRASRHIIVALKGDGRSKRMLENAGVEVHCLELAKSSDMPNALLRLIALMRKSRPDVAMTWHYRAHFLGTLAAIASGIGSGRMVWNVSGSTPNDPGHTRTTRLMLRLLTVLSPIPWAIAAESRSARRAHQTLGFRPRRWFRLYNSAREATAERVLNSYRQLWRFASGIESFPARPGVFRRRIFPRLRYRWAQLRRSMLVRTTFIGVTGSCGKTTSVSLAAKLLATDGPCHSGVYQNGPRFSVRTALEVPANSKYCIQEVSAHYPGAIARHVETLRPHIAIVITIGMDHYTAFRGLDAIAKEKGQLVEALPKSGIAILNADDPHVRAMAARTRARVFLFGLSPDAELRAVEVSSVWPDRLSLTVVHGQERVRICTKLAGEHWTASILAAIACGVVCGIDLKTCAKVVEAFDPRFGRYSIHDAPGGSVYVLDSEKAPFWTVPAGLAFLASAKAPRKTAVFGTISDYPGARGPRYRRVAREALEVADRVVFVGPNSAAIRERSQGELRDRLFAFQTSYQANAFLAADILPEELVYIKASRADHLERLMLSQFDGVVCWREQCGRPNSCVRCPDYRKPHAPPLGLAGVQLAESG